MKPLMIAHRGDTTNFSENTIEAFKSAFEHGADGIEFDIRVFNDQLIVVHDYYFDKTKEYPLLTDVLDQFLTKGRLEIEVKSLSLDFLPHLKQELRSRDTSAIELTTSNFFLLPTLREHFPTTSLGINFPGSFFEEWMQQDYIIESVIGSLEITKANVAHVPQFFPEIVSAVHQLGKKFHLHIPRQELNTEIELYTQALQLQVDQCSFDDMNLLAATKQNTFS